MTNKWFKFTIVAVLSLCLALFRGVSLRSEPITIDLVQEAQQYYDEGDFDVSLKLLQQLSATFASSHQTLQQAQIQSLISLTYQQLGDYAKAKESLDYGLALLATQPENGHKQQVLAQLWNSQGHFYLNQGKEAQAINAWKIAQKLYDQIGDRMGEKGSLTGIAQALQSLGFYRRSCDTILEVWEQNSYHCELLEEEQIPGLLGTISLENPALWQVTALNTMGNSLFLMGKFPQAQAVINQALQLKSRISKISPFIENNIILTLGNIQKAIALQSQEINEIENFLSASQKAIALYQQLIPFSSTLAQLQLLEGEQSQLDIFIVTQNWSAVQAIIPKIHNTFNHLPVSERSTHIKLRFACALSNLKEQKIDIPYSWDDIAKIYLNIAEIADNLGSNRLESYALGDLGKMSYEQKLTLDIEPEKYLEQALNLAQKDNAPELAYRWQWQLGRIYRQQGQISQGISAYQAAVTSLSDIRSDLVALEKEVQFSFREKVKPVYKELVELLLTAQTPEQINSYENLNLARDMIEGLKLAELDNYFKDACLSFKKQQIEQLDPTAAVIYTIVLPDTQHQQDRLEIILSLPTPNSLFHYETIIPKSEFQTTIENLRQYLLEPDRIKDIQSLSHQIYSWLIEPVKNKIKAFTPEIKTLVFINDGVLQNIPMSVLYNGTNYLIDEYAIAFTSGLQLLNPNPSLTEFAALAGGVSEKLSEFPALKNVIKELNTIQLTLNSKNLLNSDFKTANLTEEINLNPYTVIHLATHGQFSSNPNKTFIRLWDAPLNIKQFSQLLQNRDLDTTKLIDLLVLSACETATGDERATLGLAGMAVRTGVNSTLATLWEINDESTAVLMENFYKNWKNQPGVSKAEALRQAQIKLRTYLEKEWDTPFYWAAYTLVGKWQ